MSCRHFLFIGTLYVICPAVDFYAVTKLRYSLAHFEAEAFDRHCSLRRVACTRYSGSCIVGGDCQVAVCRKREGQVFDRNRQNAVVDRHREVCDCYIGFLGVGIDFDCVNRFIRGNEMDGRK